MSGLGGMMMLVLAAAGSMPAGPAGPGTSPLTYTVAAYVVVSVLLWGGLLLTAAALHSAQRKGR